MCRRMKKGVETIWSPDPLLYAPKAADEFKLTGSGAAIVQD